MEDTCTVDLKDAKFSYYACDLLQVANVTANPRRRLIGETRIKVSGLPKTIRNRKELCTRLLQPELEAFNQRPSEHRGYWLRVSDSTDLAHLRMDLIKVSGWPLANVEAAHDQLVALFAPTSYSVREADQDWLLHGDLVAITATFALGQKPYFDDFYELVRCYEGYKQSDGHRTAESLPFYASTAPQTLEFHGTWQQYRMAVASLAKLRDVALEYFKQCCDGLPSPPPSAAVCPICLHPTRSDCYKLKGCGHVFCRICLNRHVLTCETSREKVPFACAACEEPFRSVDIQ
ncbi:unnamed protein product, partial [Mesorhabditis spiculigera]